MAAAPSAAPSPFSWLAQLVNGRSTFGRLQLSLFYASAAWWKLNTSFLDPRTSCAPMFFLGSAPLSITSGRRLHQITVHAGETGRLLRPNRHESVTNRHESVAKADGEAREPYYDERQANKHYRRAEHRHRFWWLVVARIAAANLLRDPHKERQPDREPDHDTQSWLRAVPPCACSVDRTGRRRRSATASAACRCSTVLPGEQPAGSVSVLHATASGARRARRRAWHGRRERRGCRSTPRRMRAAEAARQATSLRTRSPLLQLSFADQKRPSFAF